MGKKEKSKSKTLNFKTFENCQEPNWLEYKIALNVKDKERIKLIDFKETYAMHIEQVQT